MLAERTRVCIVAVVGLAAVVASVLVTSARTPVADDPPILAIALPAEPVHVRIEEREHTEIVVGPRLRAYREQQRDALRSTCNFPYVREVTDADRAMEAARREMRKRELLEDRPWVVHAVQSKR